MAGMNPWRAHRLKEMARKAVPWVIYPCALIGFLNACSSACASSPHYTDPNQERAVASYGTSAVAAYLTATSTDPSPAASYFDVQQLTSLPPVPADLISADSHAEDLGPGRWSVTTVVTTTGGVQETFQLPVVVTGTGSEQRYSTAGLPSRWPGILHGSPVALSSPQELPDDNPAAATVLAFLRAWLTGDGDPQRYARPNIFPKWDQPPFTTITPVSMTTPGHRPDKRHPAASPSPPL